MNNREDQPQTVDDYIGWFPEEVRGKLRKIRATIRKAAPKATEGISYQIPTYKMDGDLVHFAAYKRHIAIYPAAKGSDKFNARISAFLTFKSTVRFPLEQPVPYDLVAALVKLRVKENLKRSRAKI